MFWYGSKIRYVDAGGIVEQWDNYGHSIQRQE